MLLFGLCLQNCSKEQNTIEIVKDSQIREKFERDGISYLEGDVKFSCGTNQCGDLIKTKKKCQVTHYPKEGRVECTCDGCVLTIEEEDSSSDYSSLFAKEDLHSEDAIEYLSKIHNEVINSFTKISIHFGRLETVIEYEYELANGDQENLIYINSYSELGEPDGKVRINCTGVCGCREIYNLKTKKTECSCSTCTMTVEDLDS